MVNFCQFEELIDNQEDVRRTLEHDAPKMIDFFESSLQQTETMLKIDYIEMPRDADMISFLSNEASLD